MENLTARFAKDENARESFHTTDLGTKPQKVAQGAN